MAYFNNKRAFISLPVLVLFLFVISLSYQFNQAQAKQRQWLAQTEFTIGQARIWQAFEFQVLSNLQTDQALSSSCGGLCALDVSQVVTDSWPNQYHFKNENLWWIFEAANGPNKHFRVCAKRESDQLIYCWWLKESLGQLYWFASLPINN